MPAYQPTFQLTHRMTALVADIAERLGAWKAANRDSLLPVLRRGSHIHLDVLLRLATRYLDWDVGRRSVEALPDSRYELIWY